MKSVIAIVAGSLFIVVASLVMQLVYIFLAVGYNALAKDYPFLNNISGSFRYIIGMPAFTVIMFFGGYITAAIANVKVVLHCVAVVLITVGGMILPTLDNSNLTITGIVVILLALGGASAGGLYWQKDNKI
jgi:hypothetical protein